MTLSTTQLHICQSTVVIHTMLVYILYIIYIYNNYYYSNSLTTCLCKYTRNHSYRTYHKVDSA